MLDSNKPLVTIIIPTYNHGRYLGRALQSIIDQTHISWEAIVIDNNSNDNTDEVIASFCDNRIKLLKIHNYGIIATSRNAGIREAKGEWIAFLDSDDWWEKEKLEKIFCFARESVDLIYHELEIVSDCARRSKKKVTKSRQLKSPIMIDLLVNGNTICTSSVVVRAKFLKQIGGMNENKKMIGSEDYNTWLRISELTENFLLIPNNFGFYLDHPCSVSKKDMSVNSFCAAKEFLHLLNSKQKKRFDARLAYASGRYNYLQKDTKRAVNSLKKSLKCGKISARIKSFIMLAFIFTKYPGAD